MLTEKVVPTACDPEEGEKFKVAALAAIGKAVKTTTAKIKDIRDFIFFAFSIKIYE